MSKVILTVILAVVSSNAMAEWVRVGRTDNATRTIYANPSTISKNGNIVKMWSLQDFKTPQISPGNPFLSYKELNAYDCRGDRARRLSLSFYSENMGGGNTVFTNSTPDGWEPLAPDSVGETLLQEACRK